MNVPLLPFLGGLLTGLFGVFSIATHRKQAYLRGEIAAYLAGVGLVGLAFNQFGMFGLVLWGAGLALGLAGAVWWYRVGVQEQENFLARLTRRSGLVRGGRTDVREVGALLPRPRQEYDPRDFYQKGTFFMGLDEHGKPLAWAGSLPHVAIAGTTGSGKGRKLQDIAAQSVANGEALVYLDPKNDEWGPHALHSACRDAGVDYRFLSLTPDAPPQINILAGASLWEIEELFTSTLDLADTGTASDFYRAKDRAAARTVAEWIISEGFTLSQAHAKLSQEEFWVEEAPGFLGKLGELAKIPAINASQGYNLEQLVAEGGGLYVVGSMTLQAVRRAQQTLFVRIQQLASRRDRIAGPLRTVCVVADEAKYHISRPILQGLGASRDKGMRVVLAFQSFADLRDCPADLSPEMVIGAIVENSPCKLIYRLEDPDTAEWLARKSGIILVDDETRFFDRNLALAETGVAVRSVRQAEHYLLDTNKLMNLPSGWGVLYGQGIAKPCYVSPYRVAKNIAAITPVAISKSTAGDTASNELPPPIAPTSVTTPNAKKPKHSHNDNSFFSMEDQEQ